MISNSFDLLSALKRAGHLQDDRGGLWWPSSGTSEIIISAILTQNTRWQNVEKALANLRQARLDTIESLRHTPTAELAALIRPSGFYNTKAKRIGQLIQAILDEFGDFKAFQSDVTREWLLQQKGIGEETSDAILCYACGREVMVVDAYTARLLQGFGYAFETYGEIQEWLEGGIQSNWEKVEHLYGASITLHRVYARFHGKIVEYCKDHCQGKQVSLSALELES